MNPNGSVGSTIASSTTNAHILWRPPSTGCLTPDGTLDGYQIGGIGACYQGDSQLVVFAFGAIRTPARFIYGLSFSTTDFGAIPTHVNGPYDGLNFGLTLAAPSVGINPALDTGSPFLRYRLLEHRRPEA